MSSDEQDLRRSAALGAALRTNRRTFLGGGVAGLGALALGSLDPAFGGSPASGPKAKAKRVIYLFQSGAPSQFETLDPKPGLVDRFGVELPESVRQGQRLTTMTSGQSSFPIAPSKFGATRRGESGALMGDLLTHTGAIADKLCIVRSMVTEAINHDPAITFIQTGAQLFCPAFKKTPGLSLVGHRVGPLQVMRIRTALSIDNTHQFLARGTVQ